MTLIALLACNTQSPDSLAMDPVGRVAGTVHDVDGAPLDGVLVSLDGLTTLSDSEGTFVLDGVEPSDRLVVEFTKDGFARGYQVASLISWETAGVDATLTEIDGYDVFDARTGGLVQVGEVEVVFSAGAIVFDGSGDFYDGDVVVEITHLDPHTNEMDWAPGDLTALAFNKGEGSKARSEPVQLVSYGMADITLLDDEGNKLQLAEGETARITMPISNGDYSDEHAMLPGDTEATWSFSPDLGTWIEEGVGTVTEDDDGELRFTFDATHFSWWNSDKGMAPGCAFGTVYDMLGFPVRSARVEITGNVTNSVVYTDENGNWLASVMLGEVLNYNGSTWVGAQNWEKNESLNCTGGCELYDSGPGAGCQIAPTITIDVCRESGVVMGDNVKWDLSTGSGDGDQLRAWFWEPEGTPSLCTDPWEEMEDDECVVTHPEDFPSKFTPRTYGLESAQGTRSAGGWVSMSTPRTTYTMESTDFEGSTVYEMQTIALGPKVEVETNPVDLQGGDVVRGSVAGNLDSYFGPVSNEDWFTVPARADLGEGTLGAVARTAGLDIPVGGNASEDDLVVMVTGEPDEPALLCRKSDDGNLELPSTELSEMNAGWASVSVYRGDFGWTMGPDGLPIRYQALSGEIKEVELR